jgi:subtilisin family serine protease
MDARSEAARGGRAHSAISNMAAKRKRLSRRAGVRQRSRVVRCRCEAQSPPARRDACNARGASPGEGLRRIGRALRERPPRGPGPIVRTTIANATAVLALATHRIQRERTPHRRITVVAGVAALLCGGGPSALASPALGPSVQAGARFEPGHVIVRYRPGTDDLERAATRRGVDALSGEAIGLARAELLRLPAGRAVPVVVADLQERPDVEFAQPDWIYQLEGVPNDPRFREQWSLHNTGQTINTGQGTRVAGTPDADIDAPEVWDATTGSDSIVVGVIDSGVNTRHPDLVPNLFVNAAEAAGVAGVDDDGNGRVDDVNGFDFRNKNGRVSDDANQHGTLVASVIGARGGNGLGVTGVAQQVKVLPLQAASDLGEISTSAAVEAVAYARQMRAQVVNMSFGAWGQQSAGDQALEAGIEASPGILFTTSAGNQDPATGNAGNNDVKPHWPSNLTVDHANVIAVAGTDNKDALSATSSFGPTTVDLAAPGDDILGASVPLNPTPVLSENFQGVTPPNLPAGWLGWLTVNEFGTNSVTDSPGAGYAPNANTTSTSPRFNPPADATLCDVAHDRRRRLARGDFFRVAASNDDGLSYFDIEQLDTDSVGPGLRSTPDPPRFRTDGSTAARVQFWLQANGDAITDDGVYVDNVAVRCGPSSEPSLRFFQGTSLSSPAVAGVAALMLSKNPALTPRELKAGLRNTADRVAGLVGRVSTNGRLNADKAVRAPHALLAGDEGSLPLGPISDTQPPIVTGLALVPSKFRPLRSGGIVRAAAAKRGSRLRFHVNETARVRLAVDARKSGRRVGRRCLRPERIRRKRPKCIRYAPKGTYLMPGQLTGLVRRTFSGRIRRKAPRPGPYRLSVTATDLVGNRSKPARTGFRILGRARPRVPDQDQG